MEQLKPDLEQESGQFRRTDSFRKVLPTKPSTSVDSRLSMSGRMVKRPSATSIGTEKGAKGYAKYILEYALMSEFQKYQKKEISGLYVNPSDKDPLLWYGVVFLHEGFYQGGVFRFEVHFPSSFPDGDCPRVVFGTGLFHPAISSETGDLNVAAEFHKWRKTVNHVWQVLQYTKDILIKVETNTPLNQEAAKMLQEDPVAFQENAKKCAMASRELIYLPPVEDDINYIHFEPYVEEVHGSLNFPHNFSAYS